MELRTQRHILGQHKTLKRLATRTLPKKNRNEYYWYPSILV